MDTGWRLLQIDHDRKARKILAEAGRGIGARLWDWEAVTLFYEIVIALGGYTELRGMPAPQSHRTRRALVGRHLPHLVEPYDALYALSLEARYYDGYAMTEYEGRRAARCHEMLVRSIPVQ